MASFVFQKREMRTDVDMPIVFRRNPERLLFHSIHLSKLAAVENTTVDSAPSSQRSGINSTWHRGVQSSDEAQVEQDSDDDDGQNSCCNTRFSLFEFAGCASIKRLILTQCSFGLSAAGGRDDDDGDKSISLDLSYAHEADGTRSKRTALSHRPAAAAAASLPSQLEWLDISDLRSGAAAVCFTRPCLPPLLKVLCVANTPLRMLASEFVALLASAPLLERVDATRSDIGGNADLSLLARSNSLLEQLVLSSNSIGPACDMKQLPSSLRRLHLNNNKIRAFDLTNLPRTLLRLYLDKNPVGAGAVDLSRLPPALELLSLEKLKLDRILTTPLIIPLSSSSSSFLSGGGAAAVASASVIAAPYARINLAQNNLVKTPSLTSAPFLNVAVINLSHNKLSLFPPDMAPTGYPTASAVVVSELTWLVTIDLSYNALEGDLNGDFLARACVSLMHLRLNDNPLLTGDLAMLQLPSQLVQVDLSRCGFTFSTPSIISSSMKQQQHQQQQILFSRQLILPKNLTDFSADENKGICGAITLGGSNLPIALERLSLSGCSLEAVVGDIDLYPQARLMKIDLSHNNIRHIRRVRLCDSMERLDLRGNEALSFGPAIEMLSVPTDCKVLL